MSTMTQTRPMSDAGRDIAALAYVTLPVSNIDTARQFYCGMLGFEDGGTDRLPGFDAHAALRLPSGQFVILTGRQGPNTNDTGVHNAFRVSASARAAIAERLAVGAVAIRTYKEDREQEVTDNFYVLDPDGNRLQLVVAKAINGKDSVQAIDHTVALVYDMIWAESFYGHDLKLPVESRFGVRTADHARARRWAAGEEDMAPGTRRLDKLYMTMGGQNEVPRANMQVYFAAGDSVFGLYLATKHQQEPPEEQVVGTPRTAFMTSRSDLDRIAGILQGRRRRFQGPVEHPASAPFAASLYCKDLSGNFLEFCAPRR